MICIPREFITDDYTPFFEWIPPSKVIIYSINRVNCINFSSKYSFYNTKDFYLFLNSFKKYFKAKPSNDFKKVLKKLGFIRVFKIRDIKKIIKPVLVNKKIKLLKCYSNLK